MNLSSVNEIKIFKQLFLWVIINRVLILHNREDTDNDEGLNGVIPLTDKG